MKKLLISMSLFLCLTVFMIGCSSPTPDNDCCKKKDCCCVQVEQDGPKHCWCSCKCIDRACKCTNDCCRQLRCCKGKCDSANPPKK